MPNSTHPPKHPWKLLYNPQELDAEFSHFLKWHSVHLFAQYSGHKENNIKLPSELIISIAQELNYFLHQYFHIPHSIKDCEENISTVKKNFIQKTVFQKYKNTEIPTSWEEEHSFTTQESFVSNVLANQTESLEKYSAFAMFTDIGRVKHKHDSIFHLPKNITQKDDFIVEKNDCISSKEITERNGFNLTDFPPKKDVIDWNLNYCLYCHTRSKDSCSKGLNEQKHGCPLQQDISESILLKKENFHIGALAAIMKENPLCILTGRRICQNCEEACIFQKQDAVDIQSIETQILMDVLQIEFGVEIYNLLLCWNPLDVKPIEGLTNANILVAGLGPAGLLASYSFAKHGANVFGIDALNIEIPQKILDISQNIIQDSSSILNQPLSERLPSGIGGVMEYGITVRWNKNFLDLAIGLILRHKNIHLEGSMRIGGMLTHTDIKELGFHHIALCVGSATPQVPKINGIFEKFALTSGVMMASDFLMSLHINRKIDCKVESPVYILGCGLTAIDTACEVRALLKQNGRSADVKILYYRNAKESSSYKINHFEFKKALEEGVEIIQNIEISEIKTGKDGKISELHMQNGKIVPCKLLILAIGTKPNNSHITEFVSSNEVSFFGDCNPQYTGSVVNALASVKDGIGNSITKIKNTLNNEKLNTTQDYHQIFAKTISITQTSFPNFHRITIHAPFLAKKSKAGNVLKLQAMYHSSIALTISKITGNSITLYLENTNTETDFLISTLAQGRKVHVNGINCSSFPNIPNDCTIIASRKAMLVFSELFKNHTVILPEDFIVSAQNHTTNGKYFITVEDQLLLKECLKFICNAQIFLYNKMNCMLGGICGRCIKPDKTYACVDNIVKYQA